MSIAPPETILVETRRVWCDGATDIRSGANYRPAALGHPKVWLEIDEHGYVDCGYCDRRFVLKGGPAEGADQASLVDISEGGDPGASVAQVSPQRPLRSRSDASAVQTCRKNVSRSDSRSH